MYKKLNDEDELRSQHRAFYNHLFSRLLKSKSITLAGLTAYGK